jgi:hypothetical protein
MTTAAVPVPLHTGRLTDAPAGAELVRRAVLSWEGVTVRDGRARLGTDDLGRLPRRLLPWSADRAIARFRARYEAAADRVDRRAGVPA